MAFLENIRYRRNRPVDGTSGFAGGVHFDQDELDRIRLRGRARSGSNPTDSQQIPPTAPEPVKIASEKTDSPQLTTFTLEDIWIPPWDKEGRNNQH